jgi:elongation factor Ts
VAEISAAQVKEVRERTGAGMMDCKKALLEANGDPARAQDILRERGLAKARSKAGRVATEGQIVARVSDDGRAGVLVEVNCETDFVAKTEEFSALGRELAELALERAPADADALLALALGGGSAADRVTGVIAKLGENIQVRRLARLETGEKGFVASYIHAGGKIGTLVAVEAEDPSSEDVRSFAHNVCMHVTALQPLAVTRGDLPPDEVEKERAVLRKQAQDSGKPDNVIEKMVEGRLRKYYAEVVLVEQALVMDPDRTVEKVAKAVGSRVDAFRRLRLGEQTDS